MVNYCVVQSRSAARSGLLPAVSCVASVAVGGIGRACCQAAAASPTRAAAAAIAIASRGSGVAASTPTAPGAAGSAIAGNC